MDNCYYGRMNEVSTEFREQKGVQLYMVDNHIAEIINKQTERFEKVMDDLLEQLKKEYFKEINMIKKNLSLSEKNISQIKENINVIKKEIKNKMDKPVEMDESEQKKFAQTVTNIEEKKLSKLKEKR